MILPTGIRKLCVIALESHFDVQEPDFGSERQVGKTAGPFGAPRYTG